MNAVNEPSVGNYLDLIQQAIVLYTPDCCRVYEVWRQAYHRGLITAVELSRFLVLYERATADLSNPIQTVLSPWRTNCE
jgi:hypothetical protein